MFPRVRFRSVLFLVFLASGCSSHRINYKGPLAEVNYTGNRPVTLTVLDHRPYVLKQEKPLNYVGTIRGGYGNPFNQTTESGEPLADDFLFMVTESLASRGFQVTPISHKPEDSRKTVLAELCSSGGERLLLVTINEWQNDYYPASFGNENTYILFNLVLEVFDSKQRMLAEKKVSGETHLPSGWPSDTVPLFYQKKIGELLNDPKIARALR
jgi:hypothetical protein